MPHLLNLVTALFLMTSSPSQADPDAIARDAIKSSEWVAGALTISGYCADFSVDS